MTMNRYSSVYTHVMHQATKWTHEAYDLMSLVCPCGTLMHNLCTYSLDGCFSSLLVVIMAKMSFSLAT